MARRHYRVVGGEASLFRVDEDRVEPVLVVTVEPTRGEGARDPTAHDDDGAPCLADALVRRDGRHRIAHLRQQPLARGAHLVRVRVRVRVKVTARGFAAPIKVKVRVRVRVRARVRVKVPPLRTANT